MISKQNVERGKPEHWYLLLKLTDKRVFRYTGRCVHTYTFCAVSTCHVTEHLQYHGRGRTRAPCHQPDGHQILITTQQLICLTKSPSATLHPIKTISTTKFAQQHYPGFPPGITILPFTIHQSLSYPARCRTLARKQVPQQEAAETADKTKWLKTSAELYHLATEVLKLGLCRSGRSLKGPVFGC